MKGRFNWRHGNQNVRGELQNWIQQYQGMDGGHLPVIVGLVDDRNRKFIDAGTDFLYGDHAYFQRGWGRHNFRLIRNAHHLTRVCPRSDDRFRRWGVRIEPWRRSGSSVVVIPPSPYYHHIYRLGGWLEQTRKRLAAVTDRPIFVKEQKGRLRECLLAEQNAWAVVCCISVAGMEAALMGVPVFSTPLCCSWPVNAGEIEQIDSPQYPDRFEWACSLAYASWNCDELERIDFKDYAYSLKCES